MDQPVLAPAPVVDDPAELPAEAPAGGTDIGRDLGSAADSAWKAVDPAPGATEAHGDAVVPEHGDLDSSVYADTHAPLRADSPHPSGAPAHAPHVRTDARTHKKPIT